MKLDDGVIGSFVDQRNTGFQSDKAESRFVFYAVLHVGISFDSDVEPQLRLGMENRSRQSGLGWVEPVHGLERAGECFRRSVPVAKGNVQHSPALQDFRSGCCQAPPADVLGDRQACQGGKHPPEVVFGG
ncbi:hypothetical protein D3C73_1055030 [compost metagenome]